MIAISSLWIAVIILLFISDYKIIADRYSINHQDMEKAIGIITDLDDTGRQMGAKTVENTLQKNKLLQSLYKHSFIAEIIDHIRLDTINSVTAFIGAIQPADIPGNPDDRVNVTIPETGADSIADFKNTSSYLNLDPVDRLQALELFYRTKVVPEVAWEPEFTLSGVFAELSKDLAYSDAKTRFFNTEVLPEIRRSPELRKVADVVFGFDHSLGLYEASLNRYVLVKFDNNNAMFIPYNVEPSASAENISMYINHLKKDEILEKLKYWGRYAIIVPAILFLLGIIIHWSKQTVSHNGI